MKSPSIIKISESNAESGNSPELELLDEYFSLSPTERKERFADTATAAEIAGLSQRTIQLWIEMRVIGAIVLGRKYMVSLPSLKAHLRSLHTKLLE